MLDSGASHHVTHDLANLHLSHESLPSEHLFVADGKALSIKATGSTTLNTPNKKLYLDNVQYVPHVSQNLVSVSQLCHTNQVSLEFFPWFFEVKDLKTKKILLRGRNEDHLYKLPTPLSRPAIHHSLKSTSSNLWHHRLGHPDPGILHYALQNCGIHSVSSNHKCLDCLANKSHKLSFHKSSLSSSKHLEFIFSDVWGHSPIQSINGFTYYVIFIDLFSRYVWLYPIKFKSHVSTIFPICKNLVENQLNVKIKHLYSNNGGEYIKLRPYLQQQGISERKHRHLVETTRCLLHHASLRPKFWCYSLQAAAYLINRLPTPSLKMQSPLQTIFKTV